MGKPRKTASNHKLTKLDSIAGGKVTRAASIARRAEVEKRMLAGYSVTQIVAEKFQGKRIGTVNTICHDIEVIGARWLDQDMQWFGRAKKARIEATKRLQGQLHRLDRMRKVVSMSGDDDYIKKLTVIENLITTTITRLYEIEADFDPENYVESKIGKEKLEIATIETAHR